MIDRRDKLLSKTGEDIRNRYNMDGFMTKAEYYANMSNNKALKVSFGGTGQTSFAKGSYLVGNGSENIGEYTSLEVRQDLGIIIPEDHITEKGVSGQWEYTKWQRCVSETGKKESKTCRKIFRLIMKPFWAVRLTPGPKKLKITPKAL